MNEEQLKFLEKKPYLLRAFTNLWKEDIEYMDKLNAEAINKDQVKKLQMICKRMTAKMTFKEKATFWKDLIKLIKLWNQQKTTDWVLLQEISEAEKHFD